MPGWAPDGQNIYRVVPILVLQAVLQLDDAMSERLAGVIRRFALQLRTAGFAGEVPKPELQCIL